MKPGRREFERGRGKAKGRDVITGKRGSVGGEEEVLVRRETVEVDIYRVDGGGEIKGVSGCAIIWGDGHASPEGDEGRVNSGAA